MKLRREPAPRTFGSGSKAPFPAPEAFRGSAVLDGARSASGALPAPSDTGRASAPPSSWVDFRSWPPRPQRTSFGARIIVSQSLPRVAEGAGPKSSSWARRSFGIPKTLGREIRSAAPPVASAHWPPTAPAPRRWRYGPAALRPGTRRPRSGNGCVAPPHARGHPLHDVTGRAVREKPGADAARLALAGHCDAGKVVDAAVDVLRRGALGRRGSSPCRRSPATPARGDRPWRAR